MGWDRFGEMIPQGIGWDPFIENKNEFSINISFTTPVVPFGNQIYLKKKSCF